jgi:hypothetical protein
MTMAESIESQVMEIRERLQNFANSLPRRIAPAARTDRAHIICTSMRDSNQAPKSVHQIPLRKPNGAKMAD